MPSVKKDNEDSKNPTVKRQLTALLLNGCGAFCCDRNSDPIKRSICSISRDINRTFDRNWKHPQSHG
jgi:hypothetical protein